MSIRSIALAVDRFSLERQPRSDESSLSNNVRYDLGPLINVSVFDGMRAKTIKNNEAHPRKETMMTSTRTWSDHFNLPKSIRPLTLALENHEP